MKREIENCDKQGFIPAVVNCLATVHSLPLSNAFSPAKQQASSQSLIGSAPQLLPCPAVSRVADAPMSWTTFTFAALEKQRFYYLSALPLNNRQVQMKTSVTLAKQKDYINNCKTTQIQLKLNIIPYVFELNNFIQA